MRKYLMVFSAVVALMMSTVQLFAQTVSFHQNDQVVIKSGISYAWVRERPTSDCACVIYTISSSKQILRILDTLPVSDGTQNWWHVTTTSGTQKQGWIEEQSLTLYKATSPATATLSLTQQPRQFPGGVVQIREGISFIWIRSQPSSASEIVSTINFFRPASRSQCLTLVINPKSIKWDGQQWWRYINQSPNSSAGWVEENSLVECKPQGTTVPTLRPDAVATSSTGLTQIPPISTYAAYQPFQNGMMIWRQDSQVVYVLVINGGSSQFAVSQYAGLPDPTDVAPASYYTPVNAFGKVWNGINYGEKRFGDRLGWAIAQEQGYTASISSYVVASAAKPNTVTDITLPDGRTVEIETAFLSWHFK